MATEEEFLRDVKSHEMRVLLDRGVYRHLYFGRKDSGIGSFSVVTYPGGLLIRGDRGDYVFERLTDMFQFFRSGPGINPGYWGEKVTAQSRHSPVKAWDWEVFRSEAMDALREYLEDSEVPEGEWGRVREEFEEEVVSFDDHGRDWHIERICEFDLGGNSTPFVDAWEWSCESYSYEYLWCCRAIQWAVERYDEAGLGASK